MNRSNAYTKAVEVIYAIHVQEVGKLTNLEEEWIRLIFICFDIIDDELDNTKDDVLRKRKQDEIVSLFGDGLKIRGFYILPQNIIDRCLSLRGLLIEIKSGSQGNKSIDEFRRLLKLAFKLSNILRTSESIKEYFKCSIIEGRISGKLIGFGLAEKDSFNLIKKLGGIGNIMDDVIDHAMDYSNGEKRLAPSISSYLNGLFYIAQETIKNKRLLLRIISNGHGTYAIKGLTRNLLNQVLDLLK